MLTTLILAFLAGVVSLLSPCVLPVLPLVLGAATAEHRAGPLALAGGLTVSFAGIGLFLATAGYALGLDGDVLRLASAVLLGVIGLTLLIPALSRGASALLAPLANRLDAVAPGRMAGLSGQFALGLLLGAVWSPCVGPTLGAASILAARGEDPGAVAATMLTFGLGAGLPMALLGLIGRTALIRLRGGLGAAGAVMKPLFGLMLMLVAAAILTSADKRLEAALVAASPAWLTQLTTRF